MDLIYCGAGNQRWGEIAMLHGFKYGAQLPNTIYHAPYFVDQDWRNPERAQYMAALAEHRPALATVLDWERPEQLAEVMSWAEEAAQYVREAVIIIPKVMSGIIQLPRQISGKQVRLGYSVPTRFAGTELPVWEFSGWPVHLLGGSPQKQMVLARHLDVHSADGNYAQKMAVQYNQWMAAGGSARFARNRHWPRMEESVYGFTDEDTCYLVFALSCMNIQAAWAACPAYIRWAMPQDIPAIKRIANQYKQELGFVNSAALLTATERRECYVACFGNEIIGFVNWHRRRDGISTVYEIAVQKGRTGQRIGVGLLAAIPHPIRLKCTSENNANQFYEHTGFISQGMEAGRKRSLQIWERN